MSTRAKYSSSSKVMSRKLLMKELARLRKRRSKPKIVFTNGCFDILHTGHISTLERAKSLGDILIVALNADASVQRLKGPTRPIHSLKARQRVMAALGCVDYVTSFDQDTPLELILELQPDWIAKGGDWDISQIVGAPEAKAWGGKGKSLRFIEGHSTTQTVAKIAGSPTA